MAQGENHIKAIWEAIQKTAYWFHDIKVNIKPTGHGDIQRAISPGVQIIFILIVLIMCQLMFPSVLRSLVDYIITIIRELGSKVGQTQMKTEFF